MQKTIGPPFEISCVCVSCIPKLITFQHVFTKCKFYILVNWSFYIRLQEILITYYYFIFFCFVFNLSFFFAVIALRLLLLVNVNNSKIHVTYPYSTNEFFYYKRQTVTILQEYKLWIYLLRQMWIVLCVQSLMPKVVTNFCMSPISFVYSFFLFIQCLI